MSVHKVVGGGGVFLHVQEWGNPAGRPILLIHGWSQNHLCWAKQFESELAEQFRLVAFDLRGHGNSDAPSQAESYVDGDEWADDVSAVIDALDLHRPVLVGWSYGGFVIMDYVRKYGSERIGGINFVGAAVVLKGDELHLLGDVFLTNAPLAASEDPSISIQAILNFLHGCFSVDVGRDVFETVIAFNMMVKPRVRGFLAQRELDFRPEMSRLNVPVLVSQGMEDKIVLPAMADVILNTIPGATASLYDHVGHAPFLEQADRFNRELTDLVKWGEQAENVSS
ncbi:pimeloyl-ACP methyl ester carboxylesterase [Sphingobium xenophagum]|uniref:Pimeloyl-ACP methyl ester carboxylesterase n=1 Tax=Sphingobium xenophagum TaxID=121428 RepID=A0ABU1X740_SPHXE|nr:alpha/beta hydrolase [Sphingobium xenophagum]MDR7157104.1 pimeloyl-ACP methyl ester carboxylesterase [Sphingobium xenophagum]